MDHGNLLGKLPNKLPLPDGNWIPQSTSEQTEAETYESHMQIAAINRMSESRLIIARIACANRSGKSHYESQPTIADMNRSW